MCELFQEATKSHANTMELALDQAKDAVRVQSKGPGDWERIPGLGGSLWSGLVFTCLRACAIESCQGAIEDPTSGEQWHFTFHRGHNEIRLTRINQETPPSNS